MLQVLTAEQIRACEGIQIYSKNIPASELMMRAAGAAAEELLAGSFDTSRILIVCGNGNNGGDGLAMARILHSRGFSCTVRLAEADENKSMSEEAQRQFEAAKAEGVCFDHETPLSHFTVLVDALFGIGLSRALTGTLLALTEEMNESGLPILALDIPSGVRADDGQIMGNAIRAFKTVTFSHIKPGLLLYPGAACAGEVVVKDIGLTSEYLTSTAAFVYEKQDLNRLPVRPANANKGTFGKVLIVAGSKGMAGAAYLSAKAAYRTGAGLVRIYTPEENRMILQTLLPEAVLSSYEGPDIIEGLTALVKQADVIAIGPGLGQREEALRILRCVLETAEVPVVADADALNLAARSAGEGKNLLRRRMPLIVTPHPGEMSRLTGRSIGDITANLLTTAKNFAAENRLICILKSARSIITDGMRTCINCSGNSGMAKGGSGDVLTGIVAGLLAQGMQLFEAAALGAYIHGLAGDAAAKRYGMRAFLGGELADAVADVIRQYEHNSNVKA